MTQLDIFVVRAIIFESSQALPEQTEVAATFKESCEEERHRPRHNYDDDDQRGGLEFVSDKDSTIQHHNTQFERAECDDGEELGDARELLAIS